MTPRYSIIIPHYNDTRRLQRLLDSIPLHRDDIEVLVIDDRSPNQEPLLQLKSIYNTVIWLETEKNAGAGHARNIGLDHITGQFLLFADSDDEFTEDAFDIIDSEISDGIELYYFLAKGVHESNMEPSDRAVYFNYLCHEYIKNPTLENALELKGGHLVPWAKIYKTEVVKKLGVRHDTTMVANDMAFNMLSALQIERIKVIPKVIYKLYRRSKSLTTDLSKETFLTRLQVSVDISRRLKEAGIPYRRPASRYLLLSMNYGPKTFFNVLWTALASDLKLDFMKAFSIKKWCHHFHTRKQTKKELDKLN